MNSHFLTQEQKLGWCKIIKSPIEFEYLLSIQWKHILEFMPDISTFSTFEITCEVIPESNKLVTLVFNPPQRTAIKSQIQFLKETSRFTWFLHSNKPIDNDLILKSLKISFNCLEN